MTTPSSMPAPVPAIKKSNAKPATCVLSRRQESDSSTPRFTSREKSLIALLETELSYGEIAARSGMRPNTMKSHMKNIFEKVGVRSRHGVVAWHLRNLLTPQGD